MRDDNQQALTPHHDASEAQSPFESTRLKSGVYIITNTETGDCYIWSAVKIEKRLTQHRRLLRLGKHHSKPFQEAWNHYGEDAFVFDVVEIISDQDKLIEVEQRYLDERKPAYNSATLALRNGAGIKSDPEQLERKREAARRYRFAMMAIDAEVSELRATSKRDDDIMKVICVAKALSPEERRSVEESADLATHLYKFGLKSSREYLSVLRGMAQLRIDDLQSLADEWQMRGLTQDEMDSLANRLRALSIGRMVTPASPRMTRTELALIYLAGSVARDLHERNDSQGFAEITGDVNVAGRIVGDTRRQIEAATGQPVVSPRNMIREPDGGLWAQLPAAEPDQEDE